MTPAPRPLARAVHRALHTEGEFPAIRPAQQSGFSLLETVLGLALATVLAAGVYSVYRPTQGLAQVQTQTALLDQLKTNVDRTYGASPSYVGISASGSGSGAPPWMPRGLTNVTNWGAITVGPAQTNVANDSWSVSFPSVPTRDCEQTVLHELNNWSSITVNGHLVSDTASILTDCSISEKNVVAFVDYRGAQGAPATVFSLPPGAGTPTNPPPGAPTPPVQAPNYGPSAPPPPSLPSAPPLSGPAASPGTPAGPGASIPPPPGAAPPPSYPSTCVVPSPQTQTVGCPSGQLGSITQMETASCPYPFGAAVWGPWTTTSNTCAPVCVAPLPASGTQTATCPSGQVTSTGAASFTQTQTINYSCPAPTGSYTIAYGPWTPSAATACAPQCTVPAAQTQTIACPAGQLQNVSPYGSNGVTQTRTASCPTPTGPVVWGAWTTTANICTPACTLPPPNVGTDSCSAFNGTPQGATYSGTFTVRSDPSCATPVGPIVWGAIYSVSSTCAINNYCSAPGATASTQNQTVTSPGTCPSNESGVLVYTLAQSRTATTTYACTSPYGSNYSSSTNYSAWVTNNTTVTTNTCRLNCVSIDSFVVVLREGVETIRRAGDVVPGDLLCLMNPLTGEKRWGLVSYSQKACVPGLRLTTESGVSLTCSRTAPLGVVDGPSEGVLASAILGRRVAVNDHGQYGGSVVVAVEDLAELEVQHITCENDFFLAGDEVGRYVSHHNMKACGGSTGRLCP